MVEQCSEMSNTSFSLQTSHSNTGTSTGKWEEEGKMVGELAGWNATSPPFTCIQSAIYNFFLYSFPCH